MSDEEVAADTGITDVGLKSTFYSVALWAFYHLCEQQPFEVWKK